MSVELNEELVSKLCKFMRVIDVFNANKDNIADNPKLVMHANELTIKVKKMMDMLNEDQQNYVLEVHKLQKEYIKEQGL